MSIGISVHFGGKFITDQYGVRYSKPAVNTYWVEENFSFEELQSLIYEVSGYNRNHWKLEIQARMVQAGKYVRITLGDEGALRGLIRMVVRSGDPLFEVYACRIHRESGARCSSQNSAAGNYQPNYEPHTPFIPMPVPEPEPQIYSNSPQSPPFIQPIPVYGGPSYLPGPEPNPHPRPPPVQEDPNESEFEFMNEVPEENLQTGDEWDEGDWDINDERDEEDEEENTQPTVRQNRENTPLSGRSETHPFVNFNDTSAFREADVSYYAPRIEYRSELAKGQYFANKKQLTKKINEYHVDKNKEIYRKRSDRSRLEILCSTPGCRFKLKAKATYNGDTWMITEQDKPHTCTSEYTRTDHAQLTASIIADIIEPFIKEDPTKSIRDVAHCVRVRFGSITPKYNKLWRGREIAVARQFGSWEESYNFMKLLLIGICDKNPGSVHQFVTSPIIDENTGLVKQGVQEFKAVAWAYGPCITAFNYLRPVISIDAAFLSGRYEGRLLMACGYDAENQLLPLAFGIVHKENEDNWGFFLHWLRINVIGVNTFVCVISDQHKGIKAALKPEYGWDSDNFVHRYCIQHVADNLVQACGKDPWYGTRFKQGAKKKKPRRLKEMFEDFAMVCLILSNLYHFCFL